jgi:hypothetical protein
VADEMILTKTSETLQIVGAGGFGAERLFRYFDGVVVTVNLTRIERLGLASQH